MKKGKRKKHYAKLRYRLPTKAELQWAETLFNLEDTYVKAGPQYQPMLKTTIKELHADMLPSDLSLSANTRYGFRCVCEILENSND